MKKKIFFSKEIYNAKIKERLRKLYCTWRRFANFSLTLRDFSIKISLQKMWNWKKYIGFHVSFNKYKHKRLSLLLNKKKIYWTHYVVQSYSKKKTRAFLHNFNFERKMFALKIQCRWGLHQTNAKKWTIMESWD